MAINRLRGIAILLIGYVIPICVGQISADVTAPKISIPLEQWKSLVSSGNAGMLKSLYSVTPAVKVKTPAGEISTDAELAFWSNLKVRTLKVDVSQINASQPGLQEVVFSAEIQSGASSPAKTVYINEGQIWQMQGTEWRLVVEQRTDPARLQQPIATDKDLYHPGSDAHAELKQALLEASKANKRVIVVFGANWCFDCHVLDLAFHRPDLAVVIAQNYEVIHVDVGQFDKNQDIVDEYQVPIKRGIPAVAVLDGHGKLLYTQKNGEFENARSLGPEDLMQFLKKWKP